MLVSTVFSYILSKTWTFEYKKKIDVKHLLKYFLVLIINFIINCGVNGLVYRETHKKILSFILATFCAMTINYLLQRFFVFKEVRTNYPIAGTEDREEY